MTLLTGGGALAEAYVAQFGGRVVSARSLADDDLIPALEQAEVVVHNAALIRADSQEELLTANLGLTARIVTLLERWNPGARLLSIGSMSYLDLGDSRSYAPLDSLGPYARSKYLAERAVLDSSLETAYSIRMSTLFYGNPTRDGLSQLVSDAATTGRVTLTDGGAAARDFLPLHAAAGYLHRMAVGSLPAGPTVNLATGRRTSFLDVARHLAARLPQLEIADRPATSPAAPVLADFDLRDVTAIGLVGPRWEDAVADYLERLLS
ncbi:MAG: NAD-dependent epimerase/dehydratase family protein [Pseudolysinimonas sp.]|uniref:NAD-dependent epimerase/dehydratase family protein n=1 Tax=Pseudolysinimonas sp. TaxID=2680009 RepID=UPI0032651989